MRTSSYQRERHRLNAQHYRQQRGNARAAEPIIKAAPSRRPDGRFASDPAPAVTLGEARRSYERALAGVCRYQGLTPLQVQRQLGRPGRRGQNLDATWRQACYARQLALYLANTIDNIPQALLARVVALTPAAVCTALRAIEDLRDHSDYETLCALVAVDMERG